MPDVRRVIEMVFSGTDQLSDKIATITKEFEKSQKSITSFAEPMASVTAEMLKLEAAAVAVGAAMATYAVAAAIKFQDSQTGLSQVLGETNRSMASFGDSAIELSNQFGTAATAVTDSFASFSSAGFAADQVEGLTTSVLKFATASNTDATQATDGLVRILKGFNAEASESPAILDMLTANTDKYATNVEQMTEALARSSAIGKASNMTIQETIGVLTPMVEVFQSAELASTAFNAVMQRLTSDNKNVIDALEQLGVAQTDSNGRMRAAKGILADVQKAYTTLDSSQKPVVTGLIAGAEHAAKFTYVFDGLQKTTEATAQALAGVGNAVDERLRKRLDDTSLAMSLLGAQFNNLAIIAGGPFLGGINDVGGGISALLLQLQELAKSEGFNAFAAAVTAQLDIVGKTITNFAAILPEALKKIDFSDFLAQLGFLQTSISDLFSGVDFTTPEGLAKAFQLLIDIMTQFVTYTRGVVDAIDPVITAFQFLAGLVAEMPSSWAAAAGVVGGLSAAYMALVPAAKGAFDVLGGFGKLLAVGGEFIKGIEAASAATTILGGSLVTLAGQIAVVAAAGFAFGTAVNKYILEPAVEERFFFDDLGASIAAFVHGPGEALNITAHQAWLRAKALREEIERTKGSSTDFATEYQKTLNVIISGQGPLEAVALNNQKVADSHDTVVKSLGDLNVSMKLVNDSLITQSNLGSTTVENMRLVDGVYTNLDEHGKELSATTDTLAEKQKLSAEQAAKLALETQKLDLEWAQIRSQERIVVFEAQANLHIEELKNQAEQFKAVMQSLDKAIESTGDTITGLAKLFVEAHGKLGVESEITSLLRKEQERRDKAFQQQEKLIAAQLKYLEVSTARLAQGDALITINGEGLQEELQVVLDKIVQLAQIKASGLAGPLLLGLPNI